MKKAFPIILVLITLSLLSLFYILYAWLDNVQKVQEEQVRHQVRDAIDRVADELGAYKGASAASGIGRSRPFPGLDNMLDLPHNYSISQRFTAQEIYEKIRQQFDVQKLNKVPFEFGIVTNMNGYYLGRRSNQFEAWNADSANHFQYVRPITPPGGSAVENLAPDEMLIVVIPRVENIVDIQLRWKFALAILFVVIVFAAFGFTLYTMLRQKKLAQIKNDFINNMTHEFKTPIATISLAVDALRNEKVQADVKKLSYFSEIIKEENQRMNRQVETILKAALLERQEIQLNRKELDAHQIIQDVADNFMLRLQEKGGSLGLSLDADNPVIYADEVHFSNLVNNLMDNAVKYSKENVPPRIQLTTSADERRFFIRIEDNGIGMNRETLKRIFEKFYRAHTGNIHNVKGFGLGLSYVKSVVEAHQGHIKAESTLGKGSAFTMDFPLFKEDKDA
ncbi:sensor histidine kinase [Flaviaesturariibacter aridisoli]|uniref:histidine kinase n=1 Tax=Flaviaesturariibacter aridisoli TaxID=2545761 RepID=A0A4R4DXS7_9BACT|nr:HAMP domain-containing sensor histidine kinase [Flaviaesturariibacter aridisoli]TCZ69926.1 HAMP domain-containing histidine kinase [Flaviaesturariibacter aridisoli]